MTDLAVDVEATGPCPACHAPTVTVRGAVPWCPACEWRLGEFEPDRRQPEFGWRRVDRLTHRIAYRLTRRQFAALAGRTLERPRAGPARVVLVAASVLLLAAVVGLAFVGAWLTVRDFPSGTIVLGVPLLALAVALRPRFGRLDPGAHTVSRQQAPALFQLVDAVAAATKAPAPHVVAVDATFNAYAGAVGLRRRRVLCLGLPLWASLPPQQRVALLGHELGHFVNGDVRRGVLLQPALNTLGVATDLTSPTGTAPYGAGPAGPPMAFLAQIAALFAQLVQWILSRLLWGAHLVLVWIGLRDAQRAEYLADEMAARAAGSQAALALLDGHVYRDGVELVVRRCARTGEEPGRWRIEADQVRLDVTGHLPAMRQLSVRDEASLFASHPPTGLRVPMIESRPQREPAVVLTEIDHERIDAELATQYERARREIGWTG